MVRNTFYQSLEKNEKLPIEALLLCGGGSGAFTSVLLTPIELVKCKMQVQTVNQTAAAPSIKIAHPGPLKLIGQIYRSQGVKGFFHGGTGTFFRETGGSAAWFGAYEVVTAYRQKSRGGAPTTAIDQMLAGAAGKTSVSLPASSV